MTFGTLVHEALAAYYPPGAKRGPHPAETFLELYDSNNEQFEQWDEEGNKVDARELGWAMLNAYVHRWGDDSDWIMIEPEMTFQIDVYDEKGNYLCTVVGKFDGVAKSKKTGRTFLPEHKTAKTIKLVQINSGYGEQGLSYWWAATMWLRHIGVLKENEFIDSVFFNFLRKALPDERPRNAKGHYLNQPSKDALVAACADHDLFLRGKPTKDNYIAVLEEHGIDWTQYGEPSKLQPPPFFLRQELQLGRNPLLNFERRIRAEAQEMDYVRRGKLPVFKRPSEDCSWKCPFYSACEVHEMGGDWEGILELDFKEWEPYSDHELDLERR